MLVKMNDLKINVPLADADDTNCDFEVESLDSINNNNVNHQLTVPSSQRKRSTSASPNIDSFGDEDGHLSGSLEDLVTSFDEKISSCFKDFRESTEEIAPVQIRTQEELMNECQMWWTLTGNYGNILPIDWSKSYTRALQLNALNIKEDPNSQQNSAQQSAREGSQEDEELAAALDMHSLLVNSPHHAPLQTADQVIQEIDEIMQVQSATSEMTGSSDVMTYDSAGEMSYSPHKQSATSEMTGSSDVMTYDSAGEMSYSPHKARLRYLQLHEDPDFKAKFSEATSLTCNEDKLKSLTFTQLMSLQSELESLIQVYNEALVEELALREEMDYEKELKNTFISLMLSVQRKRRDYLTERKRQKGLARAFIEGDRLEAGVAHPQVRSVLVQRKHRDYLTERKRQKGLARAFIKGDRLEAGVAHPQVRSVLVQRKHRDYLTERKRQKGLARAFIEGDRLEAGVAHPQVRSVLVQRKHRDYLTERKRQKGLARAFIEGDRLEAGVAHPHCRSVADRHTTLCHAAAAQVRSVLVQRKRRDYVTERKRQKGLARAFIEGDRLEAGVAHPQFVTAVIPFNVETQQPSNAMLQSLIKILKAVDDNDPGVPSLLTDYILNVLCPNAQDQAPKLLVL